MPKLPKHKQPSLLAPFTKPGKLPRLGATIDSGNDSSPVWLVARMDMEGDWSWDGAVRDHMKKIWQRLRNYESMTWKEIDAMESNHFCDLERICKEARERLLAIRLDDEAESLYQLEIGGKERLFGVRHGREFMALWWDPLHTVCPVAKKNT